MNIYLIRHGEKESSKDNPSLTPTGIEQAQKTAKHLTKYPITHIYASPYLRTQQTAQYIADQLGLPITTDERLQERMDFQKFEGDRPQFFDEWVKATQQRDYTPKSGRSSRQTANDIISLLDEIEDAGDHQHVVLVTHGGTIADFLRSAFDESITDSLKYQFADGEDYRIDECSVTRVTKSGKLFSSHNLHSTTHL